MNHSWLIQDCNQIRKDIIHYELQHIKDKYAGFAFGLDYMIMYDRHR